MRVRVGVRVGVGVRLRLRVGVRLRLRVGVGMRVRVGVRVGLRVRLRARVRGRPRARVCPRAAAAAPCAPDQGRYREIQGDTGRSRRYREQLRPRLAHLVHLPVGVGAARERHT